MKLTKTLTVALHRKLWSWIADETEKQQRCVQKWEYPLFRRRHIISDCWCCKFTQFDCEICPIKWHVKKKMKKKTLCQLAEYGAWRSAVNAGNWCEAARLARVIAKLPERKNEDGTSRL